MDSYVNKKQTCTGYRLSMFLAPLMRMALGRWRAANNLKGRGCIFVCQLLTVLGVLNLALSSKLQCSKVVLYTPLLSRFTPGSVLKSLIYLTKRHVQKSYTIVLR